MIFFHSVIRQLFIKYLLYSRRCQEPVINTGMNKTDMLLPLVELTGFGVG